MKGKAFLVGAGPGDPELLTLKALRVLKSADVVLHDDLVSAEILNLVAKTAYLQNVGKRCGRKSTPQDEINRLLVSHALAGLTVVRLKGGDPLVFGRAGEEIEALQAAGIEYEIVPGITAAIGAAASARIPLTHRNASSTLIFLTRHHSKGADQRDNWPSTLPSDATIVVYMPGYDYAATKDALLATGLSGKTACAVISQATRKEQQVHRTTIERLPQTPRLPSPTLLVVGEVVNLAPAEIGQFLPQWGGESLVSQFAGPEWQGPEQAYSAEQEQPE